MKSRLTVLACCVFVLSVSSRVSAGLLLCTENDSGMGGAAANITALEFGVGYVIDGVMPVPLIGWTVSPADIGNTIYIVPGMDPDFAFLANLLTNGINDELSFWDFGGAYGHNDFNLSGQNTDFIGHTVDSISLTVNRLTLENTPNWTEVTYAVTYNFWGEKVPEPATILLLGLGGMVLRRKK